jgi:hypothetical protein
MPATSTLTTQEAAELIEAVTTCFGSSVKLVGILKHDLGVDHAVVAFEEIVEARRKCSVQVRILEPKLLQARAALGGARPDDGLSGNFTQTATNYGYHVLETISGMLGQRVRDLQSAAIRGRYTELKEHSGKLPGPMNIGIVKLEVARELQYLAGQNAGALPAKTDSAELTAEEQCIQVYLRDPNQSLRKIARLVGCDAAIPTKSKRLKRLRELNAGKIPRGTKNTEGYGRHSTSNLEAEDEEEE